MSKYIQKNPEYTDNNASSKFPSVWTIMCSSVNDNMPGYYFWLVRIALNSVGCALFLYIVTYIFF